MSDAETLVALIEQEDAKNAALWAESQRIGKEINALAARIVTDRPDTHTLGRWLVAFSQIVKHPEIAHSFVEEETK